MDEGEDTTSTSGKTVLTLEKVIWDEPLPTVVLEDMRVKLLFLKNCAKVDSKQWAEWKFSKVRYLTMVNCARISLLVGTLKTTFPEMHSPVMDNSTFEYNEDNVFDELPKLRHLCLDGAALSRAVEWSRTTYQAVDTNVRTHLTELHFDSGYRWLREFLARNHRLIENRESGSVYNYTPSIKSPTYLEFENFLRLDDNEFRQLNQLRLEKPVAEKNALSYSPEVPVIALGGP